ncbi:FAD-dependent oxidoreductase [Flavobacterium alkalisoli]|uniref:FAD-dependent oxidoreductase n=1 Tax=Flavobacterium alkalisoli TaxID=2602769 RepID=A0A5B9FSJ3_9FLAO|nr:NAD(P)/FAD-dependent oxidoreductase [Flavobacterium alkalisoli]QEE49086.1 FAD-dependent oxidoreductase [Flavobacterium alkalisoli]
MKNGEGYNSSRRTFLRNLGAIAVGAAFIQSCAKKIKSVALRLTGTSHILGHRLWAKDFPNPTKELSIPILIVGGGITGLSAARQLMRKGAEDFLLIELEDHTGGNSSNGENAYSKYPLGAHYLPLPNFHDKELITFLEEENIITGYDNAGYPVFDEEQLTFSPQERLFYKNTWQEGLIPRYGTSEKTIAEFDHFFKLMEGFRDQKGKDGKYSFDLPIENGSHDANNKELDAITMQQWLTDNGFKTEEVFEYVDYCCRDDFGLGIKYVSAWAGVHYFAARKHNNGESNKESVLTWPEGNARLASHLKRYALNKTLVNHIVFEVASVDDKVVVKVFDGQNKKTIAITANKVIMAIPQFVNGYIFKQRKPLVKEFNYAPWLLATITLSDLPDDFGQPLSWDNVIYKGEGVGYIYDQHQSLKQVHQKKVITYYHAFSCNDIVAKRKEVYGKGKEYWKEFVLNDIKKAHPWIEDFTEDIAIHILGHGMISPVPGFIFGNARKQASSVIENKIFFAHSDLSGISVFEEAFHQGINAANKLLNETTLD